MAWHDLRQFVDHLERRGRLRRVSVPVSRDLEITEITDRVSKASGDANVALLFERVDRAELPVAINALGSAERMARALGRGPLHALDCSLHYLHYRSQTAEFPRPRRR